MDNDKDKLISLKRFILFVTVSGLMVGKMYSQNAEIVVFLGKKISSTLESPAFVKTDTIIGKGYDKSSEIGNNDTLVIVSWQEKDSFIFKYKVIEPLYGHLKVDTVSFIAYCNPDNMCYDRALLILHKRNDKYYLEKIKQWDNSE